MPSPFPGMDPYLEAPALWRGVHSRLINDLADELNRTLPEGFAADIDERLYLVEPARPIYPDLSIRREHAVPVGAGQGGAATLVPAAEPWHVVVPEPESVTERYVKVLALGAEERVVTVIELLSPSNKALGSSGQTSYLQKQQELHRAGIALLELDLLRGGSHTVATPLEDLQRRGTWDYLACLHRAGVGYEWEIWPIQLRVPLPKVRVPLTGDTPDILLSLQAPLNRTYDRGRYAERIDYRREPEPPLKKEDAAWAQKLLRALVEGPDAAEENGSAL